RAQYNHRPAWTLAGAVLSGAALNALDITDGLVQCRRHQLMHFCRLVTFDKNWRVAVAPEELIEFLMSDASEDAWIGNLVPVQVKNRQDCTIRCGIEKLVRVPTGGERASLGFTVTNDGRHDQARIIKGSPVRVTKRVAQFAAFVNGAGRFRGHMTGNAAGKGKLFKQLFHPLLIP